MEFLKVSDDGHFLVTASGKPFFWLGDTAWELFHRLSREEADLYLSNRAAKGFNVLQAVILAERDGLRTPNFYGHLPLVDEDPTQFQEAYFAYVDEIIRLAEAKGIYVALLPTWGDKVDLEGGAGPIIFNVDNAFIFGKLVGARYKEQANIVWVLGGDRYAEGFEDIWRSMALGILAGAGNRALITYHPRGAGQSSVPFHQEDWLDFNMIQSGHGKYNIANWEWVAEDYALTPSKPTLDSEPNYEYHPVAFDKQLRQGRFGDYDVRKAAYRAVLAGAFGHTYGHHSIWQMYDAKHEPVTNPGVTWQEALDFPGAGQLVHLRRLIESRPFLSRIPDQHLLIDAPTDPAEYVTASRGSDGSYAFIYLPNAGQSVNVNGNVLSGSTLKAWLYDPRTGEAREIGTFERAANMRFIAPETGLDWVLVLDDAASGYGVPGQG